MNIENALHLDSSKIGDYMRCPRYYFYKHVCGWTHTGTNRDLIFGQAWHLAKEWYLITGDVAASIDRFEKYYRQYYTPDTDLTNAPKNLGNAELALVQYDKQYKNNKHKIVLMNGKPATEIFGSVTVGEGRTVEFRLDAICVDENGVYYYVDHKTGSQNNASYQNRYHLSMQMLVYYHVVNCIYNPKDVSGGVVDLSLFKKGGNEHIRIPIRKTVGMMNEWLWIVNRWYGLIEHDCKGVSRQIEDQHASDDDYDTVMYAFPKNDNGCADYGRTCTFYDFCLAWPNPLARVNEPPEGFKEEYWSPFNQKEENNTIITI